MDKVSTTKAIAPLQLAFKGALEKDRLQFYVMMLSDIPPQILEVAVKKLIMTNKFLPSIAEIRETAYGIKGTISGTAVPDESEAWGEVVKAVRSVGYCGKPKFSHEAITTAVNNIGWQDICMTTYDGMNTLRAQFRRVFQLAAQRQKDNRDNAVLGISPNNEKLKQLTGNIVKRLS